MTDPAIFAAAARQYGDPAALWSEHTGLLPEHFARGSYATQTAYACRARLVGNDGLPHNADNKELTA